MADHADEEAMYQANILDLIYILNQIKDMEFDSFVFISTSSVKLRTQTTYSRLKRAAEEILLAFMERHHKNVCIIRPFSVTGVGEQQSHLIPALIRASYSGDTINFVPEPTHDFIDVDDLVEGIITLSKNRARGVYELGTGKSFTNQQVLEEVQKATGKTIKVNIVKSLRDYDNENWVSTNLKARGYGWTPQKTLSDSIAEMVEAYGKNRKK
jgi:UDP-glucose 4-epimerase